MRIAITEVVNGVHGKKWEASVDGPWYSDSDQDFFGDTRVEALAQAIACVKNLRDECNQVLKEYGQ